MGIWDQSLDGVQEYVKVPTFLPEGSNFYAQPPFCWVAPSGLVPDGYFGSIDYSEFERYVRLTMTLAMNVFLSNEKGNVRYTAPTVNRGKKAEKEIMKMFTWRDDVRMYEKREVLGDVVLGVKNFLRGYPDLFDYYGEYMVGQLVSFASDGEPVKTKWRGERVRTYVARHVELERARAAKKGPSWAGLAQELPSGYLDVDNAESALVASTSHHTVNPNSVFYWILNSEGLG